MGWEKETQAWWPPSATTIKPRQRPSKCSLLYINVTHWSQVWFSEKFHQLTLSPSKVLWFSLPRCDPPFRGHFIYPIPTGLAMPMQVTSLLHRWCGPAMGGGRGRAIGVSLLPGDLVEKLSGRASPISSYTTIGFFIIPPSPLRKRLPDWQRLWLSPGSNAVARLQPGQRPAQMEVSPWSEGAD